METETETVMPHMTHLRVVERTAGTVLHTPRETLQAIVQAAYDQHGILAQPSYDTEELQGARWPAEVIVDEWTTDPTELLRQDMQRAQSIGVRA